VGQHRGRQPQESEPKRPRGGHGTGSKASPCSAQGLARSSAPEDRLAIDDGQRQHLRLEEQRLRELVRSVLEALRAKQPGELEQVLVADRDAASCIELVLLPGV
jgi:hypothetical protein